MMLNKKDKKRKIPAKVLLLLLLLLGSAVWLWFYQATFVALPYNDAMDYASLGRNIARGQGITSAYMTPLGLSIHPFPQPNLWRAPLWPLVLGLVQRFFPSTDPAVAGACGLLYLAGLVLLFLLAHRLFSTGIAVASTLIYIFSPLNLHFSTSGLTEPIALVLMLFWFYLLTLPGCRTPLGDYLVGAAGGLFYLARYNALIFLPLVAAYWWLQRREEGFSPLTRFTAGFFIPAGPWLIRNLYLFGNPIFSLQKFEIPMFTTVYPAYSLYMIPRAPDVTGFIRSQPAVLWEKIQTGLATFGAEFFSPEFSGVTTVLLVLALAALIVPLGKQAKGIYFLAAACFLVQLAALAVIHYIPRLFFIFFPFYLIFGLATLKWLLKEVCRKRKALTTVLLLLLTVLFVGTNLPDSHEPNVYIDLAEQFAEPLADLTRMVGKDEVVVSNDGHLVAWYSDRAATKIPMHPEMIRDLERYAPITAIFLSHRITWNTPEMDIAWMEIFQEPPLEIFDFKLYRVYENGTLVYLKKT
jgi:hypothetical protein